jgi:hypothetical protein
MLYRSRGQKVSSASELIAFSRSFPVSLNYALKYNPKIKTPSRGGGSAGPGNLRSADGWDNVLKPVV